MTKKSPDAPPAYSTSSANPDSAPPPNYTPLTRFTIGKSTTPEPLVSILEVKGHLALLHAFAELKRHVETLVVDVPHVGEDDREKKWTWFVGLAVERFDLWCRSLNPKDSSKPWHVVLPPTDVLMVWHAYMLNPRWYAEDCMRIPECQTLRLFEPHFKMLLRDLSFNLVMNAPSKERFAFWVRTTHRAGFDPLEEARVATKKKKVVMCLNRCAGGTEVDLMNKEGTGYFQKNFRATCVRQGCPYTKITRETLALRKLAENLAERDDSALPGTLFTSSPADREKGRKIKQKIFDEGILKYVHHTEQNKDGLVIPIMKSCSYSLAKLREQMGAKEQPALIERIMSAYNDGNKYSVELIGAVLRQGSFVGKMHELGWTSPGFFDKYADELALHHALARYHAFLDLMSSSLASFFVPTLDIDLVWHTHQLMPGKYDADCKEYLQRFIDHDDKVESMKLSSAFDITCRVWKERFRVQYTHCGCPIPGDSIGQRLSRIVGMHSRPPPTSSHLVPLGRPDALAATHASDHNAVRFLSNNLTGHRLAMMRQELLARKKMRKEQELENNKAAKQKLDSRIEELRAAKVRTKIFASLKSNTGPPSSRPPPPSRSNNHDDEGPATNSQTHRYCHGAPFLLPVPLFFGGTDGGGGCVADGHTVSSSGACSSRGACFGGGAGAGAAGACASGSGAGGCGGGGGHDSGVHHGHHGFSCGGGGSSSGGAACGGGGSGGGGSTCGSSSGCGGGGCGGGGGGGGCGGC